VNLAIETWKMDDIIDDLDRRVIREVEGVDPHVLVMNVLFSRDLERVADHLTNLCEEIVFIETGKELKELI